MKIKIRYASLVTLSLTLIMSAAVFANCPNPSDVYFAQGHWHSKDHTWGSGDTGARYNSAPTKPQIKFVEASVLTGNGKNMPGSASPHVRCTYEVANDQLVILRSTEYAGYKYHWTQINNQYDAWEYIPHEGNANYGEWRCSRSLGSCSFSG